MDGLPVYYVMQPSEDDSINVFFLPPTLKSLSDVKIRDVVTHFPHAGNGKFYHFRFHTICDKDQKSWVDISNMSARAPAVDNRIYVKVLEMSQSHHSKIFAAHYGAAPQNPRPPTHTSQHPREENRSHDILNNPPQRSQPEPQNQGFKKSVSSGDKPTPNPQTIPQQKPMNQSQPSQPKPKAPVQKSADDFDLLGGGDAPSENITVKSTTTTKTTVSFSGPSEPQEDKSELYGMSRAELGAYKQQKMDEAIQDKLNFANNLWQGEEQNRLGREKAYDEVEDAIKKWSGNTGTTQRNNIRALLCTIHTVIWQGCEWNALGLSDLMTPAQIKKSYFKAITKFHPDKNQHGDYKQKYIAERVTNELNIAWDEFRKTNP